MDTPKNVPKKKCQPSEKFLEIAIVNLTSQLLFDLLYICRLKNVASLVIFHLCF